MRAKKVEKTGQDARCDARHDVGQDARQDASQDMGQEAVEHSRQAMSALVACNF